MFLGYLHWYWYCEVSICLLDLNYEKYFNAFCDFSLKFTNTTFLYWFKHRSIWYYKIIHIILIVNHIQISCNSSLQVDLVLFVHSIWCSYMYSLIWCSYMYSLLYTRSTRIQIFCNANGGNILEQADICVGFTQRVVNSSSHRALSQAIGSLFLPINVFKHCVGLSMRVATQGITVGYIFQ